MASATLTTMDAVIKELWPQARVNSLTFEGAPFWAMVAKDTDFYEKTKHIALQYGNPQGRSAAFATAQTNAVAAKYAEFALTRISDYAVGTIDGETLEATRHNKGALVSAIERETKGALEELAHTLCIDLWNLNSGTGARGAAGTISTTTLTLATAADALNFEVGQEVVAAATLTGALRSGSATITAIDYDAGTLTSDSNWTSQITSFTAADYVFVQGDAQAGGSSLLKVASVPGWIPSTAPGATAFFGLDRTTHIDRLSGIRHDGSSDGSHEEAIKNMLSKVRRRGGKRAQPNKLFMNTEDMNKLDIELSSKRRYVDLKMPSVGVSFSGFEFASPIGMITAVEDRYVPEGYAWALDMRSWKFHSLDAAPRIIRHDGLSSLRQASSDGVEFRATYRGNLACDAPGWNGVVVLPS